MVNSYFAPTDNQPQTEEYTTHKDAFETEIKARLSKITKNNKIMMLSQYNDIVRALRFMPDSGMTATEIRKVYPSYFNWRDTYHVHVSNGTPILLKKNRYKTSKGEVGGESLESMKQVIPFEHMYDFMLGHHRPDHPKGNTFHTRILQYCSNISRETCRIFTDTCTHCIETFVKKKTTAGHQPILSYGFGARGQVDLIDFQTMPDGEFKFLMNYIDHGNKLAFSTPLKSKKASAVAYALYEIFCFIGPPAILQADNGREFSNQATDYKQLILDDDVSPPI